MGEGKGTVGRPMGEGDLPQGRLTHGRGWPTIGLGKWGFIHRQVVAAHPIKLSKNDHNRNNRIILYKISLYMTHGKQFI